MARYGEENSNASLMDYEIEEIKALRKSGVSTVKIAEIFHVSQPYVSMILSGKRRVEKNT